MKYQIDVKDGSQLFVEELGEGYPILFLHGNNLNSRYFNYQKALSKKYHILLLDTRLHGKSVKSPLNKPLTFKQIAYDIDEVLSYFHIEHCLIVGHSDGANIALAYTQLFPSHVSGLLLNGGNFKFSGLSRLARIGVDLELLGLYLMTPFSHFFKIKYTVAKLLRRDVKIDKKRLHHFQNPVTVLVGQRDLIQRNHTKAIKDLFPNSQLVVIPKMGHNIAPKNPKLFNHYIEDLILKIKEMSNAKSN